MCKCCFRLLLRKGCPRQWGLLRSGSIEFTVNNQQCKPATAAPASVFLHFAFRCSPNPLHFREHRGLQGPSCLPPAPSSYLRIFIAHWVHHPHSFSNLADYCLFMLSRFPRRMQTKTNSYLRGFEPANSKQKITTVVAQLQTQA